MITLSVSQFRKSSADRRLAFVQTQSPRRGRSRWRHIASSAVVVVSATAKTVTATCPAGTFAVGGGGLSASNARSTAPTRRTLPAFP